MEGGGGGVGVVRTNRLVTFYDFLPSPPHTHKKQFIRLTMVLRFRVAFGEQPCRPYRSGEDRLERKVKFCLK